MNLKKYIIGLAILPMFSTACQDDTLAENQAQGVYSLNATMDQAAPMSRAQVVLGGTSTTTEAFHWNAGDVMTVFDFDDALNVVDHSFTISSKFDGTSASADFTTNKALTIGKKYTAIYPAISLESGMVKLEMSNPTMLTDNTSDSWVNYFSNNMYMLATGTVAETTVLDMKHLCSLLRITYTNSTGADVEIKGVSAWGHLCGYRSFSVVDTAETATSNHRYDQMGVEFENVVTVNSGASEDFYILVFSYFDEENFTWNGIYSLNVEHSDDEILTTPNTYNGQDFTLPDLNPGKAYWFNITETADGLVWTKDINQGEEEDMIVTIANVELSTALYGVLGAEKVTLNSSGYAEIKTEDVLSVKELNFRGKGYTITSLTGIENFVNLEVLNCNSVGLTSCDLSKNTALNNIDFTSNSAMTELDLSANVNLNYLYLGSCTSLSSLNLAGCTNLKTLVLNSCKGLTSVDIPNKADLLTLNYASTKLSFDLTEYTSLIDLNLGNTGLTSLDIPETMKTRLQHFGCSSINLGTLDLSEYPNLTSLNCTNTGISTLDLTQAPNLEVLECQANYFTVLDITPLTNLEYLYCGNQQNSVVLQLKITDEQKTKWESRWSTSSSNQNVVLYEENKITIENAELSAALLSVLGADKVTLNSNGYAEMKEADVLAVTNLDFGWGEYTITSLNGIENFVNLDYLYCPASGIEEMDLSKNTKLYYVSCNDNKLTSLDLSQITNLKELRCQNNELESLTFNGSSLTFLECGGNPDLTSLDLSACTDLRQLHVYGNKMASLDLSKCTSLTNLNCENMGLTSLDVTFCTSLEELNTNNNQLATLDLSKNNYLNRLMISNNTGSLSSLDLSSATGLVTLWCEYSNLTQLIINQCTSLKELYCRDNKLTSLDLSGNAILNHLDVMNNSMTTLDLSNKSKLKKLYCTGNYLTKLDIVSCTTLNTLSSGCQYSSSDRTEFQTMELTLTSLQNERWTTVWSSDETNSHISVVVSDGDSQTSGNGMTGSNFGNGGSF